MWDVSSILLLSINKDKTMTSLFTDYFSTVGAFTLVKEASQTKKTSFSGETLKTDLSIYYAVLLVQYCNDISWVQRTEFAYFLIYIIM